MDQGSTAASAPGRAARRAGWLLLATAVTTVVAEYGRVAAGADLPTLTESLAAIALRVDVRNRRHGADGVRDCAVRRGVVPVAHAFHASWGRHAAGIGAAERVGVGYGHLGILAVVLAQIASSQAAEVAVWGGSAELVAELRWISGKIGFTLAGLAFLATAVRQWQVGGTWRRLAPLSGVIGVAMQLIWVEGASGLHRVTGPLFLVWLVLIGFLLVSGRVERRFAGRVG